MTTIPYFHVDAFAKRPFTGNPAAVMPLDGWLDDALLQAIAAEHNFAETAFIVQDGSGAADFELRWFTPTTEVALCGHATLASGHVILSQYPDRHEVHFRTRESGVLSVERDGDAYAVGLPSLSPALADLGKLVALIGGAPVATLSHSGGYHVLRYAGAEEVMALAPDLRALAELGPNVFICTAPGADTDVLSRVFVPGAGVDEDSVTGAAHAVLTPYWCAQLGRDGFSAFQASARGGYLDCRLDGEKAWLGGHCVTVVEGLFRL